MPVYIQSRANPLVKHWTRLRTDSHYRREQGSLLLVGRTLVQEIATSSSLLKILITSSSAPLSDIHAPQIVTVADNMLSQITGIQHPDGYAAEIALPAASLASPCQSLLACDAVADPGNLGTLFRTALAFGWNGIFLLPGCCDPYNDKALRAARGAPLFLPHRQGSWDELLSFAKQETLTPLVADTKGMPLPLFSPPKRPLLILGNEGHGPILPLQMRDTCQQITIPMSPHMESLNVAIAGSILMYALNNTLEPLKKIKPLI